MMNAKRKLTVAALVASALLGLPAGQLAAAGEGASKLEGAWVSKVQEAPLVWSFVLVPDASGRRASLHGSIDVGLAGGFGPDVTVTPLIGELVMTGPDSARFNSQWYGRVSTPAGPLSAAIVYIGVNRGEVKFTGPGKGVSISHIAYYLPSSDADGDGFPDPGATPIAGPLTFTSKNTRLPAP